MADWYGGLTGGQIHVQAYESSYDVAGNYSIVQINVWIERTSGSGKYSSYTDNSWIDYIDGVGFQSGSGTYDLRGGGSQLLLSGSAVVYHNSDGTRTVGISGSFTDPHGNLGSNSAGGSLTLTTIPRATQPTVSPTSGNTDANYTISYAGASTGFTHDLYYSLNGGSTYTLLASALAYNGSYVWTPASSLLPNATDVTAILRLDTKNGATLIGTKTVSLPLHVPDTIVPVVSSVSWADAQTSSPDIPTMMGGTGRYVQGWSKLLPTATSVGASGSTVTACKVTVNAQVADSGTAFGSAVALSGAVPFSAVATDTRSRSSVPLTGTVAVTAYNFPNLATFTVTRTSDAAGLLPSPTGTYLSIVPTASVSDLTFASVQKNLLEYQIEIAPKATGVFVVVAAWGSTGVSGNTWTAARVFGTYASNTEWIVRVTIRDVFGKNGFNTGSTVTAKSLNIPSESVFMDWDEGVGIGLGKYRQNGILDIKGDVYVDGTFFPKDVTATDRMLQRATHNVIDDGDAATTSTAGILPLATSAEAVTGTNSTKAVTPSALRAALVTPQGIVASSVAVGSGSASVAADGTVTFSGVSAISLNGVFSLLSGMTDDAYRLVGIVTCSADPGGALAFRLRASGTDLSTGHYYSTQGYEVSTAWGAPTHGDAGVSAGTSWQVGARAFVHLNLDLKHMASALGNKEMIGIVGSDGTNQVLSTILGRTDSQSPFDGFSLLPAAVITMSGFLKMVRIV